MSSSIDRILQEYVDGQLLSPSRVECLAGLPGSSVTSLALKRAVTEATIGAFQSAYPHYIEQEDIQVILGPIADVSLNPT